MWRTPRADFAQASKRIVDDHALFKHGVIVFIIERKPKRDGVQPCGFRRQVVTVGVGAANDR